MWPRTLFMLAGVLLASSCNAEPTREVTATPGTGLASQTMEEQVKIRIVIADNAYTAVLEDSQAARDFAALLPIEIELKDYNQTEKIADLPKRLSTEGSPDGIKPTVGDIAYYAPWGNLAIFYRDFDYSRGLVKLGRIEGSVDWLAGINGETVRIEILPPE